MMSTQQKTDVNVIAVENNSYSNAALDDEGRVWTWGNSNVSYRLGRASSAASNRVNPFNRGGQVTTTIYPGEMLPFILQISGSYQNTLALDRDGSVWSWGINTSNALGRSGSRDLPGKVEFPAGVKIKWIAAAYYGGKAIDTDGNIWVWGDGDQSGLGTGNNTDVSKPVKLTLDASNNPLPTNFIKISTSDFHNRSAAIAVTEDGKIFTWGNTADAARGGASRPKQTGENADIKKISVGNGTYGFLTNSGEIWTWGDNTSTAGDGRQGHGDTLNRSAPKRVETVVNGGTKPAPKFRDFSIYAWSMCAVDYEGNIYGTGENRYSKHGSIGTPNRLTKYLPNGLSADTKIFIVAEGYTSTSYVDVHGNAYVTGESDAKGNNHNDGSPEGPWVHFTGSGIPMFTLLDSTPTSEGKRYNTSPKTTLDAQTNIASDEIKYVIIYPDDTDQYADGETFYSKSFAEFEQPYYLKGTDPQLLLSPNYDLWSSRYYANPKISEEVFNAAYHMKGASDKGMMDVVSGSGNKVFQKIDLVSHNCIVWIQSKNASGTTRAIYRFDNYYTQTKAWHEGVKLEKPSFYLYPPELVSGGYGLFLDRHGNIIPGDPPFGYDVVRPIPNNLVYWTLSPASQLEEETLENGETHRVDREKEIYLTELSQRGDDAAKTPRVTFTYIKDPQMWVDADLYFVDELGDEVEVVIDGVAVKHESRTAFAPKGAEYVEGQDPYLPPEASNPQTKVVGYSIGTPPSGTPDTYTKCDFPNGFRPLLNEKTKIYIVYTNGMVSVTETFIALANDVETEIKNNDGLLSVVKNFHLGMEAYDSPGPIINGYVIVGHEITIEGSPDISRTDYLWVNDQYEPKNAKIPKIEGQANVRFLYKADSNGNKIPDEEEGSVRVHWIAVNATNVSFLITQKTFCGNGKQGANITIREEKETVLPTALYDPDQWLFRPGLPSDTDPYLPQGSDGAETIIFSVGPPQDVRFYYDEDYNENGIADKLEGRFTERYKLSSTRGDLTPPKADTISKWLGGQTYSKEAPLISDYVAVGYVIEANGALVEKIERVEREQTGNVSISYEIPFLDAKENYTVTLLYKEDKNSNNIPDDEEGSVTIRWVGATFAGNAVELAKLEVIGYIGDNVTSLLNPPNPIDEIWKLTGSDVPDPVILSDTPQTYQYQYIEVPEFSTITVESISTDGSLDFYYQYTKRLADEAFDVTAFVIPTYRVAGYTLYDNYGNEIRSGTGDAVRIDPSTGSQRIVFNYVSTITTVVIRAVEAEDYSNVLLSQTVTDAVIGQPYSASAPYVDNTWVLTGDVLQVIHVNEGTNVITFEYEKATGNVTVLLKETDSDGQIIRVLSETVEQGDTKDILIPDLSEAYYTTLSTEMLVVDYTGSDPIPHIVEYHYEKERMDVIVKSTDEADGSELKAVSYPAAARKGESYTGVAPSVEWYTLTESNSKSVYADPEAADNTILVEFAYKKDHIGLIAVRLFYKDEADSEVELQAYTAHCVVGSKFTAIAGSFSGFALTPESAESAEIIVSADESQNRIAFEYTDLRKTVGVFTQIGSDEATRQAISANKYVSGSETALIPPYMKNHLVTGYLIDTDAMVNVDPETFTSIILAGDTAITDDMSIVFVYTPIQDIVDDRYIDVAIHGVTGEITHYSHLKRIAKNDLPLTLSAPDDVFEVPGYQLNSAADFDVAEDTTEKIFTYYPLATTVTIRMVDGTGADVADSFTVGATAGAPFTYNAPNVPDYYLTGHSLGKVDPVMADGASEMIFTYEKITSKVTMVAKEDDSNGRIIGVFEVTAPMTGTVAYDAPDLTADYYSANEPSVTITYDGTNSMSVEVYYTKELVSVEIDAVHYLTGADLGSQNPLFDQRKGEAVTVSAPNLEDYVLIGSTAQIVIADGTNKAVFKYRGLEHDEVSVKAVDASGNILQGYILKGAVDETVWADPPAILGWKTSNTAKSAVIGTDSEIVFYYTKNVVVVTIQAVDLAGQMLDSTYVEVAKGGSYTAHAPHFPGFVLSGSASYPLTNLAADETVTFVYKAVESAVVTVTVIGKDAQGELYRDHILRSKNSGNYDVDARDVEGYRLLSITPASVDVQDEDATVIFDYESILTTVTIYMTDEDASLFLAIFKNTAVTGESFTFSAPNIAGYDLTSASNIGTISPVLPNGVSTITFTYKS